MFAFFQKKLTPKSNGEIHHVFWGDAEEWLAFDGDNGALTLLNTETVLADQASCLDVVSSGRHEERKALGFQTLKCPGKATETVRVVGWNSVENSFGTIDESGYFAVWKRDNKVWVKEGHSFNTWKGVKDCAVSPDGRKICILCSDGRLCVCTMGGHRLWSKELKRRMRHVLWSPTGLELLLCSEAGEVFFYDSEGFYTHSFRSQRRGQEEERACAALVPVADVDWYTGNRLLNLDPALAIAYENGRVEVFVGDIENEPLNFDAHLVECTAAAWCPTGEFLALLGRSPVLHPLVSRGREVSENADFIIRFYSGTGELLHSLVLPGGRPAHTFSWNRTGDKIVVASGCTLFFAKIRPKYAAAYFASTVVYAAPSPETGKQLLWFWNTESQSKHVRVVDKILHIQAAAEGCLVVTEAHSRERQQRLESTSARYALAIYSSSGDVKKVSVSGLTPKHTAFTGSHIITADSQTLCLWAHNMLSMENSACNEERIQMVFSQRKKVAPKGSSEKRLSPHLSTTPAEIDEAVAESCSIVRTAEQFRPETVKMSEPGTANHIVGLTANACCFIVAMKCGELRQYSLPAVEFLYKYNLSSPPLTVQINSDGSRLAVVDVLRVLRLYDAVQPRVTGTSSVENRKLDALYERDDVERVLWASDDPECFAVLRKNVFYIARGTTMEEVVECSAHLLDYRDLCVRGVYFDKLRLLPSSASTSHLFEFRTKPLRDTKAMLQNPRNLHDGLSYISQRSHPNLWRLLAMAALKALNFTIAEEAYVKCQDYFGLLFLKYVSTLNGSERQMAEVHAYFGNVDEAERLHMSMGRMDLALASMSSAGEWCRVLEMCREHKCGPKPIQEALSEVADFYKERSCWFEATEIYRQLQNKALLAHALYVTEQYEELYNLAGGLDQGDDLLLCIGRRLASVGMCTEAVNTFRRAGHFKFAEDVCVNFKDREPARRLLGYKCSPGENGTLTHLAECLLQHNRINHGVELPQRGSITQEAVTGLLQRALSVNSAALPSDPVKAKMMYVLAGRLAGVGPKRLTKPQCCPSARASEACLTRGRSPSLKRRLKFKGVASSTQGQHISTEFARGKQLETPCSDDEAATYWRGAEAYHLFVLYHGHMARKRFNDAVCTAARLVEYSEYVKSEVVHNMLALASYHAQNWRVCSMALMHCQSSQAIPEQHKANIASLAVDIFSRYCPVASEPDDPSAPLCPRCQARLQNWDTTCHECGASFPFCVGSGRSIFADRVTGSRHASFHAEDKSDAVRLRLRGQDADVLTCCMCRRQMFATVTRAFGTCPLCHTSFTAFSATVTEYHYHVEHETSRRSESCDRKQKE